jgi:hypothetical protein
MSVTKFLCAGLLFSAGSVSLACDLPPLVAIPAKEDVGGQAAQLQTDVAAYVEAMRAFTACVQAELVAAGGDAAPTVVKAVLVNRNNLAVAEVDAVLKALNEVAAPPATAAPAPAEGNSRGRER